MPPDTFTHLLTQPLRQIAAPWRPVGKIGLEGERVFELGLDDQLEPTAIASTEATDAEYSRAEARGGSRKGQGGFHIGAGA